MLAEYQEIAETVQLQIALYKARYHKAPDAVFLGDFPHWVLMHQQQIILHAATPAFETVFGIPVHSVKHPSIIAVGEIAPQSGRIYEEAMKRREDNIP